MITPQSSQEERVGAASAWRNAIASVIDDLRVQAIVDLPAGGPDWVDSGLDVHDGEEISLLSAGAVWLSEELNIGFRGNITLWYRIGRDGDAEKSVGVTTTFRADRDGRLLLAIKPPGEWQEEVGEFDRNYPRAAKGGLIVAALVWRTNASSGLAALSATDASGIARIEHNRIQAPVQLPAGWHYLQRIGNRQIFCSAAASASEEARIECECKHDVGILRYPINAVLDESTKLTWRWCVSALPSRVNEDTAVTHDYLSIAVEFENGFDLTYMWSSGLPVGTTFRCPLSWWRDRETHQVVRSGTTQLGKWLNEERSVLLDYRRAIGGEAPARVVAVWLIAVSAFQQQRGACAYANIRLSSTDSEISIGP